MKRFEFLPMTCASDGRKPQMTDGFNLPGRPGYDPDHRNHRGCDWFFRKNHPESPPKMPFSTLHFEIEEDTVCVAPLGGLVVYAELCYEAWLNPKSKKKEDHCTGWVVVLDHGTTSDGKHRLRTASHHLASVSVAKNQVVAAGQEIGIVGGSPNRAGSKPGTPGVWHCHGDVMLVALDHVDSPEFDPRKAGTYVDPWPFFKQAKAMPHPVPSWQEEALEAASELSRQVSELFK